jgi:hypothetical protein
VRVIAIAAILAQAVPAADLDPARRDELNAWELPPVIAWRRGLHAHPQSGNRERRSARIVAHQLCRDNGAPGGTITQITPAPSCSMSTITTLKC